MGPDITDPRWLYAKAVLLAATGLLASSLILLEWPSIKLAFLLCLAIWSSARAYYFVFYVIQHYIDPAYKFSGLGSFIRYLVARGRWSTGTDTRPPLKVGP